MFYLLVLISYNGNWSFAQKFYSVKDERAARKAGLLATFLKLAGPPLFVLPAMAARHLMPELAIPPNSPQYTYAALSLKYLPPGLVGLMIAAMFSATMSTLSGDFNVTASVITNDIYHRLLDRKATARRLVLVGRLATLFAGAVTVGIGTLLVATGRTNLFELMVKLFGLFVGPMLLPMLAGLVSRKVTWRGAAAGIAGGFLTGGGLQLYKLLVLDKRADLSPSWLRYDFEAMNIAATFAVTLIAMAVVTAFSKATREEQTRIDGFFERLNRPIAIAETAGRPGGKFSPLPVIGVTTGGVGALLLCAALATEGAGRLINVGCGILFCLIGVSIYMLAGRMLRLQNLSSSSGEVMDARG
jgi:Na+/proline symporter